VSLAARLAAGNPLATEQAELPTPASRSAAAVAAPETSETSPGEVKVTKRGWPERLRRAFAVELEPATHPRYRDTAWSDTRAIIRHRAIVVAVAVVTLAASIAGALDSTLSVPLKVMLAALGAGVGSFVILVPLVYCASLAAAPHRQRNEARRRTWQLAASDHGASLTAQTVVTLRRRCRQFADELDDVGELAHYRVYVSGTNYRLRGLALLDEVIEAGLATPAEREIVEEPATIQQVRHVFRRIAAGERTAQEFLRIQLKAGNAIHAAWPAPLPSPDGRTPNVRDLDNPTVTAEQLPRAVAWEQETYAGLGHHLPQWQEHFRVETNLGPDWFREYRGEPPERAMLRRRVQHLAEIQTELNRGT
jgi:hypothetical protein